MTACGGWSSIPEEVDARTKTEEHYDTPTEMHLDTLARPFYTLQHNRYLSSGSWVAADYESYVELDVQGNRLAVHDARGLIPLTYRYNPLQQPCKTISIDSGTQRVFTDVAGQPIYSWDADNRQFHILYDELRRPLEKWCDDVLLEVMEYGEAQGNGDNHNGKLYLTKDGAGMVTMAQYDFKGNPLRIIREFAEDYTTHPDWNGTVNMEGINYDTQSTYDALSRPVTTTTPDTGITSHTYDAGGNLYSVDIDNVHGLTDDIILEIQYNAKGQRTYVQYNNFTSTQYTYDPLTFRLRRILTIRSTDSKELQDIYYWYDPVGNITLQRDEALQTVFFDKNIAYPENDYTYDALYRLIKAGGREHEGNSAGADADSWNDANRVQLAHTHDETKMRPYVQNYVYDEVGNMLTQQHVAGGSYNWTKNFTIDGSSNRLTAVSSAMSESYNYDSRGNLVYGMSHLGDMSYNALNRLELVANSTGSIITYYQYDAAGQRVRKVTEDNNVNKKHTRKYIGGWEVYSRTDSSSNVEIERETLHIADDTGRVAIIDTPTIDNISSGEHQTLRYQYSNHLGSATLELADDGDVISYEEYYPYGTTSFQSGRSTAETSLKRYRFAAAERDDESGLYYMGARYYVSWLCRWCAPDPINNEWYNLSKGVPNRNTERDWIELTASPYEYTYDNPIRFNDPTGEQPNPLQYLGRLLEIEYQKFKIKPQKNEPHTGNPELKGKEWRTFAIKKPFEKTGGDFQYRSISSTENLGSYAKTVDESLFIGNNTKSSVHVNEKSQFLLNKENVFANDRQLVNHLLGNFIYGKGPENIVFPENGKFSNMLKGSIAVGETLVKWRNENMRDGDYSWGMDTRGQINVGIKEGITSLENFLGSVRLSVETLENGMLRIGIFNITSLTSGDLTKDFTPDILVTPLKSTTRDPNSSNAQTEYSNISQYFSFTISKEEAMKIINRFSPPGNTQSR